MKDDPSNLSMLELFRVEAENQTALLTSGLLELESRLALSSQKPSSAQTDPSQVEGDPLTTPHSPTATPELATLLESLMRAAHSLKGAARIVNLPSAVRVAHAMEDCFVAAQAGQLELHRPHIDLLLRGVDLLANLSKCAEEKAESGALPQAGGPPAESSVLRSAMALSPQKPPSSISPSPPSTPLTESSPGEGGGLEGGEGHTVVSAEGLRGEGHNTTFRVLSLGVEDFVNSVARLRAMKFPPSLRSEKAEMPKAEIRKQPGEKVESRKQKAGREAEFQRSALPPATSPASRLSPLATEPDRVLRLTAENLNRLLGLAGESLVESRWLRPFAESMQRLKRMQSDLERTLDDLRQSLENAERGTGNAEFSSAECGVMSAEFRTPHSAFRPAPLAARLKELFQQSRATGLFLSERLQELDLFDRRSAHLSNRLYLEVLRTRMRPFADGTRRFPRMVRDLARSLGKQARLEIVGENTPVDRDILDRLETPLAHLLRNALDHGCELPEERVRAGKPAEALIRVEARHSAGMLLVTVADDGAGLDWERLRGKVASYLEGNAEKLKRGKAEISAFQDFSVSAFSAKHFSISALSEAELVQFLFLPGFSLRESVTELSGRGVGLDIVQNMVKSVRGSVKVRLGGGKAEKLKTEKLKPGFSVSESQRFSFWIELQLPLTLSVLRTLLVEVGGEPYAFPLAQIAQTFKLRREQIETLEGRQHFKLGEQPVGLVAGRQLFGPLPPPPPSPEAHGVRGKAWRGERATKQFGVNAEMRKSEKQSGENAETLKSGKAEISAFQDFSVSAFQKQRFSVSAFPAAELSIVVLGEVSPAAGRYGLVVDRFLGERELVVQPLDPRLGKVQDISAAALMEDGAPVLIVDVDDLLRSIEKLVREGAVENVEMLKSEKLSGENAEKLKRGKAEISAFQDFSVLAFSEKHFSVSAFPRRKRILAVDDSLTVRELERKLLTGCGYVVDVAHDGMEAWERLIQAKAEMLKTEKLSEENAEKLKRGKTEISAFQDFSVSAFPYDLVITDVDMPRLDGIELATLIKRPSSVAAAEVRARHPELLRPVLRSSREDTPPKSSGTAEGGRVDDEHLKSLPVMIVSYKDREEDRLRGLAAGADYYLTKGSFEDDTLLQAVQDLIGEPCEVADEG